ncbi:diguanylate cyclase domain-containing protein [Methylomonas sp. MgM2]
MLSGSLISWYGNIFDGVRAYVRGEGLWAKAQKDAVFHLSSYSYSRDEADYYAYRDALKVIGGDKRARLALLQIPPDYEEARIGFVQGQNHPDDIQSMIDFFLKFQRISYMRDAVMIWETADQTIEALKLVGEQIRNEIKSSNGQTEQLVDSRVRLRALNDELLQLENQFSMTLGEGARWVKKITWQLTLLVLLIVLGLGVLVSRQIIKSIASSERQLLISELRFRRLKESNTIGIISWRMDGLVVEANDLFLNMLGYDRADLKYKLINWREITPSEFRQRDRQAIDELLMHGRCDPFEKALIHKHGHVVPILFGAAMLVGEKEVGIAYVVDLTERKQAEQQLKLAATVFSASSDGILITDAVMHIVSVNQALCKMTGYDEHELLGKPPTMLQSGYTSHNEYEQMWQSLNDSGQWQGELFDRKKSGALLPVRVSINRITNAGNELTHYVAILSDISQRKAEEAQLRHIAYHDPLTGLANRVLFDDMLDRAIQLAMRNHSKFAVLFLDLDKFKPVNDVFGHKVGDQLLKLVAQRLVRTVRNTDTVTRLGGDEFVVLLEAVSTYEKVEKTLKHIIDAICMPYYIDENNVNIGVSAGISIFPDHGTDAKTLLHHADVAMYDIKSSKVDRRMTSE